MTPEELAALQQQNDLEVRRLDVAQVRIAADDLKSARSQAFKWTFTIASISTALGILGAIKVPEKLPDLTSIPKWALAFAMFFAVLFAAISIAFAGTGAADPATGDDGAPKSLLKSRTNIKDALDVSRYAAVLAFVAISVAIGIVYLGNTEPPRYFLPQVDATTGQTSTVCGVLVVNGTTGAVELKPETDPAIAALPIPDTTKLEKRDDGCQ